MDHTCELHTSEIEEGEIAASQCSPVLKNISDLSCSEDCMCDRCTHVKFAVKNTNYESMEQHEAPILHSTPISHSTLVEMKCKFDFIPSQTFRVNDIVQMRICKLRAKLDQLSYRVEMSNDDNYLLNVAEKMEIISSSVNCLL